MDTYGHLLPSLDDQLTDALEERFQSISQPHVDDLLAISESGVAKQRLKTGETPA